MRRASPALPGALLAMALLLAPGAAGAEPLRTLDAPGIRVVFAEEALEDRARDVARRVPPLVQAQARVLGVAAPERVTVSIARSAPRDPARRRALGLDMMPSWAAGMAIAGRSLIVIRLDRVGVYPDRNLQGVLAHEVAHLMLDQALGPYRASEVPRWFDEGFAMSEAHRITWGDRWELARSLFFSAPIPLSRLEQGFPREPVSARAAYAQSFSFIAYVLGEAGQDAARDVVRRMSRGANFHGAWRDAMGLPPEIWEREWRRSVTLRYRWIPALTSGGSLWLLMSLLMVAAIIRKRRRTKEILSRWDEEERFLDPEPPKDPPGGWVN